MSTIRNFLKHPTVALGNRLSRQAIVEAIRLLSIIGPTGRSKDNLRQAVLQKLSEGRLLQESDPVGDQNSREDDGSSRASPLFQEWDPGNTPAFISPTWSQTEGPEGMEAPD